MKILLSVLIVVFTSLATINAQGEQSSFEQEIQRISTQLAGQLNARKVKRAAVADFSFKGKKHTRIGVYIANELSTGLTMYGAPISMVSRQQVRRELYDNSPEESFDLEQTGYDVSDATSEGKYESKEEQNKDNVKAVAAVIEGIISLGSKKKLAGVDVIIYGTIEDIGDYIKVNIEVVKNNKKADNIGAARGQFIKTPVVQNLLQGSVPVAISQPSISSSGAIPSPTATSTSMGSGGNMPTFKHQNVQFEVIGCTQNNRDVECKLNIIALENDARLYVYKQNTRIIDANGSYEFYPSELRLADLSTTGRNVEKTLVANVPIEATLRFTNVNRKIVSIARLEINSYANVAFLAKLDNISVH